MQHITALKMKIANLKIKQKKNYKQIWKLGKNKKLVSIFLQTTRNSNQTSMVMRCYINILKATQMMILASNSCFIFSISSTLIQRKVFLGLDFSLAIIKHGLTWETKDKHKNLNITTKKDYCSLLLLPSQVMLHSTKGQSILLLIYLVT